MIWRKFIPLISAAIFLFLLEYSFRAISLVWWWDLIILVMILAATLLIFKNKEKKWLEMLTSVVFVLSSLLVVLFLDRSLFRQAVAVFSAFVVLWNLSEMVSLADNKPQPWGKQTLEVTNLFSLFFLNAVLSGWLIFLTQQFWLILLAELIVTWFFIFFLLSNRGLNKLQIVLAVSVLTILLGEVFWSISLLPIGFLMQAILQTVVTVYLSNLLSWHAQKRWQQNKIIAYSVISFLIIIIVLISARWL